MKSWSQTFATQTLFRRSGTELFDTFKNIILLRIYSTIKYLLMKNEKFQENLSRPDIIDARARRLRNTGLYRPTSAPDMYDSPNLSAHYDIP